MKKCILMVLVDHRTETAPKVQSLLTEYGCNIKTRLGLHDTGDNFCSNSGLIVLELIGDQSRKDDLYNSLKGLPGIDVQRNELSLND